MPDTVSPPAAELAHIQVAGLTRRFGPKVALHPIDLEIGSGITGLLGPNGSGKSTLMRILVGLVRPDAGTATVAGVRLAGDGTAVRKKVAYMPGEMHLYGELTGAQHLDWLLRGRGRQARRRAREGAEALELPLDRKVRGYSHGMKRQLCFAAAMAPDVPVRILDEPTDGLDPSRRSKFLEQLTRDAASGVSILLSSHHFGEVDRACDRLIFMSEGELVADETASSVADRARRVAHLSWSCDIDREAVERALVSHGVQLLHSGDKEVSLLLESPDPRPFLSRLAAAPEIDAPQTIEYGRISLQEFYRDLYGVEGC
ncbi:MAG: ATP-binding cassette domain-containing protein [bacterium]|nr:ATP-binding cassette domain-containing protein [bacterium]